MGFTKIRAPFDGLVTAKLADPGAMAAPAIRKFLEPYVKNGQS